MSGLAWQGKIWLTKDPMVNGRSLALVPDSFERRVYHRVVKQIARGTLQWGQGLYQAISHPADTIASIASNLFQVAAHPVNAYDKVRQSIAAYQSRSAIDQSDAMVRFATRGTLDYALFKAGSVAFNRLQQARLLAAGERIIANTTSQNYWPNNRGFAGAPTKQTLLPGMRIDRFGYESGTFVSPEGIPSPMRSLASGTTSKPYNIYEVVKPIDVESGTVAPWFNQPGGGVQYELNESVQDLLDSGHIRKVGN